MSAEAIQFPLFNDAGALLRTFPLPLHRLDAPAAPTAGDDDADGYVGGSVWVDRTNDKAYVCVDNAAGAAVWTEIGSAGLITGPLFLTGIISPAVSGDEDDWSPTGLSGATIIRADTSAASVVTGLQGGASGRVVIILNVGVENLTLAHEDAGSTAGNRFVFHHAEDQLLKTFGAVILWYDATSSRWRGVNNNISASAGGSEWTTIKKTADESKDFDTTLATDTELQFAMAANTKYHIKLQVFFDTGAVADFKYSLSGPASPTLVRVHRGHIAPQTTTLVSAVDTAYTGSTAVTDPVGSIGGWVGMDILVHNGANSGTFGFQWAQNASDVTPAVVRAGSYLEHAML